MKAQPKKETILVVDDIPENLDFIKKIMSPTYFVQGAINGPTALKVVDAILPDLILLDIVMPEMDGMEVCRRLKENERTKSIPIIFITSQGTPEDQVSGLELGADDYIVKPFNPHIVQLRIQHHLELKRYRTHLETLVQERTVQLEESTKAAQAADRAKGEFLSVMSHEIRTPLNIVLGMAEVVLETDLDSNQSCCMDVLYQAGNGMLTLVEDILDLTNIESGILTLNEELINLQDLVSNATNLHLHNAQKKGLKLTAQVNPGTPSIFKGDPKRMRLILLNLLGNAVKFTSQGHITLQVSSPDPATLIFSVEDTGIGISKEEQTKIFEMFSLVDASNTRQYGGVGLGLSLCKRLVDAMNGSIKVKSETGKGSTFQCVIPLR